MKIRQKNHISNLLMLRFYNLTYFKQILINRAYSLLKIINLNINLIHKYKQLGLSNIHG